MTTRAFELPGGLWRTHAMSDLWGPPVRPRMSSNWPWKNHKPDRCRELFRVSGVLRSKRPKLMNCKIELLAGFWTLAVRSEHVFAP